MHAYRHVVKWQDVSTYPRRIAISYDMYRGQAEGFHFVHALVSNKVKGKVLYGQEPVIYG